MLKYVYTKKSCSACDVLKKELADAGTKYINRNGDRLALDPRVFDDIDKEAFVIFQMQNLTLPVEVDIICE